MASESNTSNIATNIAEEMKTVIIADVRYEIPKAVADLLASSKSLSDSNPKTTMLAEDSAGVGNIDESEKPDDSVLAGEVSVKLKEDVVVVDATVAVNPEGVISTGVDTVEKVLEPVDVENVMDVLKNPEVVGEGVLGTAKTGDVPVLDSLNEEESVQVVEDFLEGLETSKTAVADSEKSGDAMDAVFENPGGVGTADVENPGGVKVHHLHGSLKRN